MKAIGVKAPNCRIFMWQRYMFGMFLPFVFLQKVFEKLQKWLYMRIFPPIGGNIVKSLHSEVFQCSSHAILFVG